MLPVIAHRKLLRKLSSAAIQTVLFSDFIYHVWELMVFPKPGNCPNCKALPEFKRGSSKKQSAGIINEALKMDRICTCKAVTEKKDKLVKCSNAHCTNGKFFHLSCLGSKRMPNNSKSWLCSVCFVTKSQEPMTGTPSKPTATKTTARTNPTVTHTTTNTKPTCEVIYEMFHILNCGFEIK